MNKKGQVQYIVILGSIILGAILLSALPSLINSINCQNEKAEIERINGLLSSCQASNNELKNSLDNSLNSLNNCQKNLNESNESCNKMVQNITDQYKIDLEQNNLTIYFEQKIRDFVLSYQYQ